MLERLRELFAPRCARRFGRLLSPYLDGELDEREGAAVEQHLKACARCRAERDELRFAARLSSGLRLPEQLPTPSPAWLKERGRPAAPSQAAARRGWAVAAACLFVAALAGVGVWYSARPARGSWEVARLSGRPTVGARPVEATARFEVGERLETDKDSRALIRIGGVGQVEVDAVSRVRLLEARPGEHRLALERGRLDAAITAPPRLFFTETPSAVAVDLGCAYTLQVDDEGASFLHVTSGWVALTLGGRESLVPAGAMCRARPGKGPGTPFLEDASEALRAALDAFDFEGGGRVALGVVLAEARAKDALTLWHLLSRAEGDGREQVYERLSAFVPPPEGVTREGALGLDEGMLARWRERAEYASVGADFNRAPAAGALRPGALLQEARFAHAATPLADGRVLLTGGLETMQAPLASAEVYDPAAGAFSLAGRMHARRVGHTATLLADGRVLVTGGSDETFFSGALPSAEVYDPRAGSFSRVADMRTPRLAHRATLLPDGRVLVTGGQDDAGRKLASAEIFDPSNGTFGPAPDMHSARADHAATLLRDGRVLITGGADGRLPGEGPVASAEIFDPAGNNFTTTGRMHVVRYKHSATLLPDGRVLVVGGSDARMWAGRYATAEIYDPASGHFAETGSMTTARYKIRDAVAPLRDGRILVAGGGSRVEIYDPSTGLFSLVEGGVGVGRYYATATALATGEVLIAGGYLEGNRGIHREMYADRRTWLYRP